MKDTTRKRLQNAYKAYLDIQDQAYTELFDELLPEAKKAGLSLQDLHDIIIKNIDNNKHLGCRYDITNLIIYP